MIEKCIYEFIQKSFEISFSKVVIWTDATTVMQWLHLTKVLPLFVQKRISEIKHTSGVKVKLNSGKDNLAEIATMGKDIKDLCKIKMR